MINAVIIEDEQLIAQELQNKIKTVSDEINIVEVLPSLKTAKKWFMQHAEPDLLFMDIQLSDGVSFELFEHFQLKCPVIFTTAYDEYAIRAFKVNGIDYLLKPVDEEDLSKAIIKSKQVIAAQQPSNLEDLLQAIKHPSNVKGLYKEKFIVSMRNNWIPVSTNNIACFVRENLNYLFTFSGEKYILDYSTLDEIEELLDPRVFYRTNRQSIIHIDSIYSVKPHENQKLTVSLKPPLKIEQDISREKAPAFKKWFDR